MSGKKNWQIQSRLQESRTVDRNDEKIKTWFDIRIRKEKKRISHLNPGDLISVILNGVWGLGYIGRAHV